MMPTDIETRIRRFTQQLDSLVPQAEELLPPEMAAELDLVQRPALEVTVPFTPIRRRRRVPVWGVAIGAAAAVLLLMVPILLLVTNARQDVAVTTPPPLIDRGLGITPQQNLIEGVGWVPGSVVSVGVNGTDMPQTSPNESGYFIIDVGTYGMLLGPGDAVVASDGEETLQISIPTLTFDELDSAAGIASGSSSAFDGSTLAVDIQIGPANAGQADRFQDITATVSDGRWSASFDPPGPGQVILFAAVIDDVPGATINVHADLN